MAGAARAVEARRSRRDGGDGVVLAHVGRVVATLPWASLRRPAGKLRDAAVVAIIEDDDGLVRVGA